MDTSSKPCNAARFKFAVLLAAFVLTGVAGCATFDQRGRAELEEAYGPNPPKLEAGYSSPQTALQDTWKIYIKGSDPDRDLRYIQVWVWIPAASMTPIRLDVDADHGGGLSGYLTLQTWQFSGYAQSLLTKGQIRANVTLEDRAGHVSNTVVPVTNFYMGAKQTPPPQGAFEERFLGDIPVGFIRIDSIGDGRRRD